MLGPSCTFKRWKCLPSAKSTSRSKIFPISNMPPCRTYGRFIVSQVQWNLLVLYLGSHLLNLRHLKNILEPRQLNLNKQNWKKTLQGRVVQTGRKNTIKPLCTWKPSFHAQEAWIWRKKRFNCWSLIWNTIGYCNT